MKKKLLTLLMVIAGNSLYAQLLHPVKWSYAAKIVDRTDAIILIKATIEDGWHIYSINQREGGPVKTSFSFIPSGTYTLKGKVIEPNPTPTHDKTFDMEVHYFEHEVIFQQKVNLKSNNVVVKGKLNFMACNDKKCLPPEDVEFNIPIK